MKNTIITFIQIAKIKAIYLLLVFYCCQWQIANGQLLDTLALSQQKTYFSLQDALLQPDSVYKLTLSKKKLKEVPTAIFQFKNLQILNLSKNAIKIIPTEISQLQNLQDLNFSANEIAAIPAQIGMLQNLVDLNLNRNLIEAIPPEIGNLKNLEVFEMWDNELDSIPDEIKDLSKLRILELRGILFSQDDQNYIKKLVPNCRVYFSPACPCINKF